MLTDRQKLRRRRWKLVAWTLSGLLTLWLLICTLAVYSLTRRSRVRSAEPVPQSSQHIDELRLATTDGEDIGAWYAVGDSQKPTVLLIHGNGGQRKACWPQAQMLLAAGYPVMLISCRAHGDSSGQFNDFGWSARHDAVAAVTWLNQQRPQPRIVVWGASLGSAASIFAAADLEQSVCGYILECPYQDLETAVWHRLTHYLPPVLDGVAYLGMRLAAGVILPQIEQISPLNHIETSAGPAQPGHESLPAGNLRTGRSPAIASCGTAGIPAGRDKISGPNLNRCGAELSQETA